MHVKSAEKLTVPAHAQLFYPCHAVVDELPSEFLHLDVVELTEVAEPLDQLRCDAAVELWERESGRKKRETLVVIFVAVGSAQRNAFDIYIVPLCSSVEVIYLLIRNKKGFS